MEYIKDIGELGLGLGSLVALVIVIIMQLKIIKEMSSQIKDNTATLGELRQNIKENTTVTREMNGVLRHGVRCLNCNEKVK